jgi:uncharacterized protein YqhQ
MPFLPVGGQAVIEGVMMRSPTKIGVAVRRADGSLATMERPFESITRRVKVLGLPVVRGAVSLFETLFLGITALNFSADEAAREEAPKAEGAKPSPLFGIAQLLTVVVSLGIGVMLFVVLPAWLTGRVQSAMSWHGRTSFGLIDGVFRLAAFVLYLLLISRWKEMARVLGFHGAEHKAIHALEANAPLTPESVQTFSRFHPRCGTTFLFIVVVISIFVFSLIGRPHSIGEHLLRVASMPLIAGVAFEFIRLSGMYYDRPLVRALTWPGMQFQRLTTREPDLEMCRVAVAALELVRHDAVVAKLQQDATAKREVVFVQ